MDEVLNSKNYMYNIVVLDHGDSSESEMSEVFVNEYLNVNVITDKSLENSLKKSKSFS